METIFQDSKGFVWFGTRDGLNRYDGFQIVVFRYNAKDLNSISDNYIKFIYEDKVKIIWVATINGLNEFNRGKNNFIRYKHNPADEKSLSNNFVTSINEDVQQNLWVSTFGGLNLLQRKNKTFTHLTILLRKAVYIMTHEDVMITDVMYSVGIQTQSYFTKAFKKEFGKTPSQFLQELKK